MFHMCIVAGSEKVTVSRTAQGKEGKRVSQPPNETLTLALSLTPNPTLTLTLTFGLIMICFMTSYSHRKTCSYSKPKSVCIYKHWHQHFVSPLLQRRFRRRPNPNPNPASPPLPCEERQRCHVVSDTSLPHCPRVSHCARHQAYSEERVRVGVLNPSCIWRV